MSYTNTRPFLWVSTLQNTQVGAIRESVVVTKVQTDEKLILECERNVKALNN